MKKAEVQEPKETLLEHFKDWALKAGKDASFAWHLMDVWRLVEHDEESLKRVMEKERAEGDDAIKILLMRELYTVSCLKSVQKLI